MDSVYRIVGPRAQALRRLDGLRDPWVLVVDGSTGQNRSALAAVRALARAGYRTAVAVSSPHSLAAASRFCDRRVTIPAAGEPGFAPAVRQEMHRRSYVAVLPASDVAIVALLAEGLEYVDKEHLARAAAKVGMQVPHSTRFETAADLIAAAAELPYPCVVKAAVRTSSRQRPARRIDSLAGLDPLRDDEGPFVVQPFIHGNVHSICGVAWRGQLVAAVHQRHVRLWPPVCGDACAAVTVQPDHRRQAQVEQLLLGYNGIFQVEFVGDHLMDVNPRVYGSLPLALRAGVNLVDIHIRLLRGEKPTQVPVRVGVGYRWWEGETRHLVDRWGEEKLRTLTSARQSATPSLGILNWSDLHFDPGPVICRLRFVARGLHARPVVSGTPSRPA